MYAFENRFTTDFLGNYHSYKKSACNKKCVFQWDLQLLFETFFWILHISWDKPKKLWFLWFFDDFTMKIKFAPIFTIIFVINASKYINIRSPKKIGHTPFSEVRPLFVSNFAYKKFCDEPKNCIFILLFLLKICKIS